MNGSLMPTGKPDHWSQHAQQWSLIGPPLRPSGQDISLLEQAVTAWSASNGITAPRALLCGVTPEIARMRWPAGTRLTAVDRSQAMIAGVWLAGEAPGTAVCGNWFALPLSDCSQDLLIGDGCHTLLVGRDRYIAFARELRRVAAPGSLLAIRYFLRPERSETAGHVIDDLQKGRIGNFHAFKWRLAMALHGTLEEGVRLGDIWEVWNNAVPDPGALAAQLGWSPAVVHTIQNYRDLDTRYSFSTMAEARALIGDFRIVAVQEHGYELGERCPTLIMQPT